jgi:hypothetical protein
MQVENNSPACLGCSILRRKEAERLEKERKKAEKEAARLAAEQAEQRRREEEAARKVRTAGRGPSWSSTQPLPCGLGPGGRRAPCE